MKKVLSIFIITIGCWQCQSAKESNPAPAHIAQSKTELLTIKNWKLSAATVNPAFNYFGDGHIITNIYTGLAPCVLDDLYRYDKPDVLTITDGTVACAGNSQAGTFKWTLSPDESVLTHVFGGSYANTQYVIESLTSSKLVLSQTKTYSNTTYKFSFEYVAN